MKYIAYIVYPILIIALMFISFYAGYIHHQVIKERQAHQLYEVAGAGDQNIRQVWEK